MSSGQWTVLGLLLLLLGLHTWSNKDLRKWFTGLGSNFIQGLN